MAAIAFRRLKAVHASDDDIDVFDDRQECGRSQLARAGGTEMCCALMG